VLRGSNLAPFVEIKVTVLLTSTL